MTTATNTTYTLGQLIQGRRLSLKLTQGQVSKAMGWNSPQFVSNIERDEADLPPEKIVPLAKLLKMKPEHFITLHTLEYKKRYEEKVYGTTTKRASKTPRKTMTKMKKKAGK